jgi:hypothetical protein
MNRRLLRGEHRGQLRLPDPVARPGCCTGPSGVWRGLRRRRKLIPELIKRAACSEGGDPVRRELDARRREQQINIVVEKNKKSKK